MKEKIILIALALCLVVPASVQAEKTDIGDADVALEEVYLQVRIDDADEGATIRLYLWWVVNEEALVHPTLRANVFVDEIHQIGTNVTVSEHNVPATADQEKLLDDYIGDAFIYDDYGSFVNGTHTVRVEFTEIENDANAANNKKEVTYTSPNEWYGTVTNGLWSVIYSVDGILDEVSDNTGMDFFADIPVVPLIGGIVILIIAVVVYFYLKKKGIIGKKKVKGRKARPRSYGRPSAPPPQSYQQHYPTRQSNYNQYPTNYPPRYPPRY